MEDLSKRNQYILGKNLKVGDLIAPWGGIDRSDNRWARIIKIEKYQGKYFSTFSSVIRMTPAGVNGFTSKEMSIQDDEWYITQRED